MFGREGGGGQICIISSYSFIKIYMQDKMNCFKVKQCIERTTFLDMKEMAHIWLICGSETYIYTPVV